METALNYLAGNVTVTDIIVVIGAWLIFNAGFVCGAGWKSNFTRGDQQ